MALSANIIGILFVDIKQKKGETLNGTEAVFCRIKGYQ